MLKNKMDILSAQRFKTCLAILIGAIFLIVPAAINGFPFIFPDSGDYLVLHPLIHRSPYYGLFVTIVSLNRFIWMPVVVQCLILSHLLWVLTGVMSLQRIAPRFLLTVALLTVFSSLPFFTGFIMADFFTPVMLVVMYLLAFHGQALSRPLLAYLFLLDCLATAAHISDFSLGLGIWAVFAVLFAVIRRRPKPLAVLAIPLALTAVAILAFNIAIFHRASMSPAGPSFLMANLIQYGPARDYLHDACPHEDYRICAYLDRLPPTADDLLWFSGIYQHLGGFAGMHDEAQRIVHGTLATRPVAVGEMVARNFVEGLVTHEPAEEFSSSQQVASFRGLLSLKYGARALAAYDGSLEMRDALPHAPIRIIDGIVMSLSFFGLGVLVWRSRRDLNSPAFLLPVVVAAFILGDTLMCTALSGVHDRYQARVTWLAPMACVALLGAGRQLNMGGSTLRAMAR